MLGLLRVGMRAGGRPLATGSDPLGVVGVVAVVASRSMAMRIPESYSYQANKPVEVRPKFRPKRYNKKAIPNYTEPNSGARRKVALPKLNKLAQQRHESELMSLDGEDRMRRGLEALRDKKDAAKQEVEYLRTAAQPKQQTGCTRNHKQGVKKVEQVAKLIRRMPATEAERQLMFLDLKSARMVLSTLRKAIAAGKHNQGMDPENMWVSHSMVTRGAFNPKEMDIRARGRFGIITHLSSHYYLVLEEGAPPPKRSNFIPKHALTRWVHEIPTKGIVSGQ